MESAEITTVGQAVALASWIRTLNPAFHCFDGELELGFEREARAIEQAKNLVPMLARLYHVRPEEVNHSWYLPEQAVPVARELAEATRIILQIQNPADFQELVGKFCGIPQAA